MRPAYKNDIKALANLPDGWDYGQGFAPTIEAQNKAIQIGDLGIKFGFDIEVRPQTYGGLVMNLYKKDYFLDVFIEKNQLMSLCLEKGKGAAYEVLEEQENTSDSEIAKTLKNIITTF